MLARLATVASGPIVTGSSVIMSLAVGRGRPPQALLEVLHRLEEHDPAEQLDEVRQVQIVLLPGHDEVVLGDDPDAAAAVVDDRHAAQLVVAQDADDLLDRRVGATVSGAASMMSRTRWPRRLQLSAAITSEAMMAPGPRFLAAPSAGEQVGGTRLPQPR